MMRCSIPLLSLSGAVSILTIACSSTPPNPTMVDGAVREFASITVSRTGTGSGIITTQPDAIYCGSTCSAIFRIGTTITLSANPDLGVVFDGWSGACEGTGPCVIDLAGDTSVTARFRRSTPGSGYALTVVSSPRGIVASSPSGIYCGALCAAIFDDGVELTLTAFPENGGAFLGWSGACSGTAQVCRLTMNEAKLVQAAFSPALTIVQRRIGRTATEPGGTGNVKSDPPGIDCGLACASPFNFDEFVTLTVRADTGSLFTGWLGGCASPGCTCTGTQNPCTITIDQPHRLTASFTRTGLVWERRFSNPASVWGTSVASDPSGAAVITGNFAARLDVGGGLLESRGAEDIFLAKYSPSGDHAWSKSFGSDGGSYPYSYNCPNYPYYYYYYYYYSYHTPCESGWRVAVDSSGAVVVAGEFVGEMNIGGAPSDTLMSTRAPAAQGGLPTFDLFVAKFSSTGQHVWSRRYGGSSPETAQGLAIDQEGDVIITGHFQSPSIDFGGGELRNATSSWLAPYLAKISKDGAHVWSKQLSVDAGNFAAWGRDVATDRSSNVFLVGSFAGTIDPGGGRLTSGPNGGPYDGFIAKYSPAGQHLWSKRMGGVGSDYGAAVAVGENGNPVVGGSFHHWADLGGGSVAAPWNRTHIYLAQFAGTDGAFRWAKNIGAPVTAPTSTQHIGGLAVDRQNNLVLGGNYWGTVDFGGKILKNASVPTNPPDLFLAKYASDGALTWAQSFTQGFASYYSDHYRWGWFSSVAMGPDNSILALANTLYPVDFGAGPGSNSSTDFLNVALLKFAP